MFSDFLTQKPIKNFNFFLFLKHTKTFHHNTCPAIGFIFLGFFQKPKKDTASIGANIDQ